MKTTTQRVPAEATRAFQPTADRSSLWLVGQYDDALRMLRAAVLGRQGLLLLVGEPGTGKTVLAHALTVRVREESVVVGRLPYPILEGMDLLTAVAEAFGLPADFKDRAGFLEQFRRFVVETTASGRRLVLVVDEAHSLAGEQLVDLARLPYDDTAGGPASISVLLIGQRGLLDTLRADGVEADILCHLRPLTREQTADYIAHRLRAAGHRRRFFTPPALRKIWVVSEGIPRAINLLCVEALMQVRRTPGRRVTAGMIDRPPRKPDDQLEPDADVVPAGVVELETSEDLTEGRGRRGPVVVAAALALLSMGAAWVVTGQVGALWLSPEPVASVGAIPTDTKAPASEALPLSELTGTLAPVESAPGIAVVVRTPAESLAVPASRPRPAGVGARSSPEPVEAAPGGRSAADAADGSAVIDWLLKDRSAGRTTSP